MKEEIADGNVAPALQAPSEALAAPPAQQCSHLR
ncbi:hypothetical protein Vi05172_g2469 [Venturia inaequalis]|nr:hypothetical protein Vi05172_g2469 [Venturia inaequalis]